MNTRHRRTLDAIFSEPVRANIDWADIEGLFSALGAGVEERAESRVGVELNGVGRVFHRPHPAKEAGKAVVRNARLSHGSGSDTMMKHGQYLAAIEYDPDVDSFYGRTVNVERGGFDFWGSSVAELRREFATSAQVFEEFMAEKGIAFEITATPEAKSQAARALGRATSPAKAAAARKNGRKGGRPRKTPG